MAQKVQILPDKVQPALRPPGGSPDSTHPNAPIRLRKTNPQAFKGNPPVKSRGNRSY